MQWRVSETRVNNLDELKQRLIEVWSGVQQNIIDAAIGKCRSDCKLVFANVGDIWNIYC